MSDGMTVMIDDATQPKIRQGGIIAIGAGGSDFLDIRVRQLDAGAVDFVLISPRVPAPTPALQGFLASGSGQHIAGLPGQEAGEGELLVYNLPGMVSLAPPVAPLLSIFPGLREVDRQTYPNIDPEALSRVFADIPDPLTLWLDLPGAESLILDVLARSGVLPRVRDLALRCGVEPFFAGAEGQAQICEKLGAMGFALVSVNDDDDPDWPELRFNADPQARRIRELEAALSAASDKITTLETLHKAQDDDLTKAKAQSDTLQKTLASAQEALTARDAAIAEARALMAAQDTALSEARAKSEAQTKALENATATLAERDKALADEKKASDAKSQRISELDNRLRLARDELRRCEGQIEIIKDLLLREVQL